VEKRLPGTNQVDCQLSIEWRFLFGILLSETGAESAAQVVGKLKQKLLELVQDNRWTVTFSIGVATFISPPDSINEMIDAADFQMYLAKQNGKNRTRYKVIDAEDNNIRFVKKA
jgi:predicted signal transduction protein with EAL and GGDEF domain